jgi:hypothetical protein
LKKKIQDIYNIYRRETVGYGVALLRKDRLSPVMDFMNEKLK